ncbi:Acyl-CoA wax alcohol acyltransferase 2 [Gonapodya sp. JEL0774]|nr:Acyl-CoA wax alcohol acyltransferase 2 [Gonapodya sp. JEL0774]
MSATKAQEHVEALDPVIKEEARAASSQKDDSLLSFVYSQVGSLIQGTSVFHKDQIELLQKTATDVAAQFNSAAQLAYQSIDQAKLKAVSCMPFSIVTTLTADFPQAKDAALGTTTIVQDSAAQAVSNVRAATSTLTAQAQASATTAAEIVKPQIRDAATTVQTTVTGALASAQSAAVGAQAAVVAALPAAAQKHVETATAHVSTLANKAQTHATTAAVDAQKLSADLKVIASDSTVKAISRLEVWIKDQHSLGKSVNASSAQRVVAALASTEAAKTIQQKWEALKAANQHKTVDGTDQDIAVVQQQVAAQAATSATPIDSGISEMTVKSVQFIFKQADPREFEVRTTQLGPLKQGEILVRIDKFGVTSNNVSYLATGRSLRYFDFFPVEGDKQKALGKMPVWGFATVTHSLSPLVETSPSAFTVRRDDLPEDRLVYLTYSRVSKRDLPTPTTQELEDQGMLLRGLWSTGYLLADYVLGKNNFSSPTGPPTKTVVIISASSKTAYSLETASTQSSPKDLPIREGGCVVVDMAGDDSVTKAIYDRYGLSGVRQTVRVGASHWSSPVPSVASFRPPNSHFFFAPGWSGERVKELGGAEFARRQRDMWDRTMRVCGAWIKVEKGFGPERSKEIVERVLAGDYNALEGFVVGLGVEDQKSIVLLPGGFILFAYLCTRFPSLIPVAIAYAVFIVTDSAPRRGARISGTVRNGPWSKWMTDYHDIRLIRDGPELNPSKNYLLACHPHGVIGYSFWAIFTQDEYPRSKAEDALEKRMRLSHPNAHFGSPKTVLPGLQTTVATISSNFWIPFAREWLLGRGFISAERKSLDYLMRGKNKRTGNAPCLVVGGAQECDFFDCFVLAFDFGPSDVLLTAQLAEPRTNKLVLNKRHGFIRLALSSGTPIVPVYAFGENDLFRVETSPTLAQFYVWFRRVFGWVPLFLSIRGDDPFPLWYAFREVPLRIVVGQPLELPHIPHPSHDDIFLWHTKYVERLSALYANYKDVFDIARKEDLRIVA